MHGYGDGWRPSALANEITKIKFVNLDLSHLRYVPSADTMVPLSAHENGSTFAHES
jgi:hypothetical protein